MTRLLTPPDVPAPAAAAKPREALHGLTVLLVEDDRDCRDVLTYWFESLGVTVVAAGSASEAVAAARRITPDVVVTDITMPGHDGCWLVGEIRALLAARGR